MPLYAVHKTLCVLEPRLLRNLKTKYSQKGILILQHNSHGRLPKVRRYRENEHQEAATSQRCFNFQADNDKRRTQNSRGKSATNEQHSIRHIPNALSMPKHPKFFYPQGLPPSIHPPTQTTPPDSYKRKTLSSRVI